MKKNLNTTYDIDKQYIVISEECNLRCSFCYVYNGKQIPRVADICLLKKEFFNKKIKNVVLIGGEPTCNEDLLFKSIRIINENKFVNNILITTNGNKISSYFNKLVSSSNIITVQISPYSMKTLLGVDMSILKSDIVTVHFTISDNNIDYIKEAIVYMNHINKHFWISIDRKIKTDISDKIYEMLFDNLITEQNFRDNSTIGKNCTQIYGKQMILHGEKNETVCFNMLCENQYEKKISSLCKTCDNNYCDACICDNVVMSRSNMCKIFKLIKNWFDLKNEVNYNAKW